MAGTRFVLAGALLLAWLRVRGAARPTVSQWRDSSVTGFFLLLGGNGLVTWSEQIVPSGVTAIIIGVTPLCITLVAWAWPGGVQPRAGAFGALLLGLAGVAWLAAPWEKPAQGGLPPAGMAALLGACVLWSVGSIHSKHVRSGAEPLMGAALQMLTGGAMQLVAAAVLGEFSQFRPAAVGMAAWGGICLSRAHRLARGIFDFCLAPAAQHARPRGDVRVGKSGRRCMARLAVSWRITDTACPGRFGRHYCCCCAHHVAKKRASGRYTENGAVKLLSKPRAKS